MEETKIESGAGSHDGIRVIKVSGPFTMAHVPDFQTAYRSAANPVTLIDMSEVPYLDSAALGTLISIHTTSQRNQSKYALTGVRERLMTLMEMTGVVDVLVMYPSNAEAEANLA